MFAQVSRASSGPVRLGDDERLPTPPPLLPKSLPKGATDPVPAEAPVGGPLPPPPPSDNGCKSPGVESSLLLGEGEGRLAPTLPLEGVARKGVAGRLL